MLLLSTPPPPPPPLPRLRSLTGPASSSAVAAASSSHPHHSLRPLPASPPPSQLHPQPPPPPPFVDASHPPPSHYLPLFARSLHRLLLFLLPKPPSDGYSQLGHGTQSTSVDNTDGHGDEDGSSSSETRKGSKTSTASSMAIVEDNNHDTDNQRLGSATNDGSATYCTSSDACVDFFFHIVPDTSPERIESLLEQAWRQDPLTALKLVFHLRGVRGTGKSNREGFYVCTAWLQRHHPLSLLANLCFIPKFGYFKDLLEIVQRSLEDSSGGGIRVEQQRLRKRRRPRRPIRSASSSSGVEPSPSFLLLHPRRNHPVATSFSPANSRSSPGTLTALRDAVADLFAQQLQADKHALQQLLDLEHNPSRMLNDISVCARCCPSAGSTYDLRTGLHHAIASRIFAMDGGDASFAHLSKQQYTMAIEKKLRKEYLAPLRRMLRNPETYMRAKQWHATPYQRVPSVSMIKYAEIFSKHDKERYEQFLVRMAAGEHRVMAGVLLPHEILNAAVRKQGSATSSLAESQWKRMVSELRAAGSKLRSSLAICDVSGSMEGRAIEVCIALGLLVAELSEEPWKNRLCTFSSEPQIHEIVGETLAERKVSTERMDWCLKTDFQKVFLHILDVARSSELPPERMVKRLFVFSDMELDAASANAWETEYVMITKMFEEAGYGDPPEMVFWNLRQSGSTASPVLCKKKGVVVVSGFSEELLKVFLEDGPLQVPETEAAAGVVDYRREMMVKALCGELYEQLVVID